MLKKSLVSNFISKHINVLNFDDKTSREEEAPTKEATIKRDPRIETGILRTRIANKIAKMNNI